MLRTLLLQAPVNMASVAVDWKSLAVTSTDDLLDNAIAFLRQLDQAPSTQQHTEATVQGNITAQRTGGTGDDDIEAFKKLDDDIQEDILRAALNQELRTHHIDLQSAAVDSTGSDDESVLQSARGHLRHRATRVAAEFIRTHFPEMLLQIPEPVVAHNGVGCPPEELLRQLDNCLNQHVSNIIPTDECAWRHATYEDGAKDLTATFPLSFGQAWVARELGVSMANWTDFECECCGTSWNRVFKGPCVLCPTSDDEES